MSHEHQHEAPTGSPFKTGLLLNAGFTVFELTVGTITGSLALIADGSHNLTDCLTLSIAYIAERISKRSADARRSYGYGRAKIIAALLNAGILVAIATFIGYEAVQRLSEPKEVPGLTIAAVALVGIGINGTIAWLLSKRRNELHVKTAFTDMLNDALSSAGALLAGLGIYFLHWNWLDSVIGFVIAIMLLTNTVSIVRQAVHILLEGVPADIDMAKVRAALMEVDLVQGVDDMHAWTIDDNYYAFSCHLVIDERQLAKSREVIETAKQVLTDKFDFAHTTLEVELKDCQEHSPHEHA